MTLDHPGVDAGKHLVDGVSVGVVVASLVNMLPAAATLLTIIWTALRIYEMRTVQRRVRAWKIRRRRSR